MPLDGTSTDLADIPGIVDAARKTFDSGRTRSYAWRMDQLERLGRMLVEREKDLVDALHEDFGKPRFEGWSTEVGYCAAECAAIRKGLRRWMRPQQVRTSMVAMPGKSSIVREPLGVVLVIAPWNYPIQLAIAPVMGALAAGNTVVLKPSEAAPASAAVMARLLPEYLDKDAVRLVLGGVPETTRLLEQRFDYIFYTGNGAVGRVVMEAAAKHLTPVTLELGGKSPCIVDRDVDLELAARRIVWGKFINGGQTCVAPDYVLAHESIEPQLVEALKRTIEKFYGADPQKSPDFARIINARHHARLAKLLEGQEVAAGGQVDAADKYIAPTVLRHVKPDAKVMEDEIFGPILPVLTVKHVDEAIAFVLARPKPLALYVFSNDQVAAQEVLSRTSSGGAVVNDVVIHLGVTELPFGGVGSSGMGAYHGKASFEVFSHHKSVLKKATWVDPALRYPPYTDDKQKWARRLL